MKRRWMCWIVFVVIFGLVFSGGDAMAFELGESEEAVTQQTESEENAAEMTEQEPSAPTDPGVAYYSGLKEHFKCNFYSDGHCTMSGRYGISGAVVIPAQVIVRPGDGVNSVQDDDEPKTYRVTEIGSFQFPEITSITISEGIEKIAGGRPLASYLIVSDEQEVFGLLLLIAFRRKDN